MLLLCFAAPPLRDNNAHIRHASPIANTEILLAPVLEFIEYIINIEFLLRFKPRFLLSNPSMQEIPRLKLRPHNNPLPKAFRIWPPCTTRYSGASSGLQRSASELYRLLSPGSLESSDLGVAPRHTRSAGLTICDCQSLSYGYQLDNHIVPTFSIGTEFNKSCGSLNRICATTKLMTTRNNPMSPSTLDHRRLQGHIRPQSIDVLSIIPCWTKDTMEYAAWIYPGVATKNPYWRLGDSRYTAAVP